MKYKSKITGGDKNGTRRTLGISIPRLVVDDAGIKNGDEVVIEYKPNKKQIIINLKGE